MAVLKTESRLPAGYAPEDLGQASIKSSIYGLPIPELGDDLPPEYVTIALVSYLTSPITKDSLNQYVVFILDPGLASAVTTYSWQVFKTVDIGVVPIEYKTTAEGVFDFKPTDIGEITIIVQLFDSGGRVLDQVDMRQTVIPFSNLFNDMVTALATNIDRTQWNWKPDIAIGNAETTNELANDFYRYIQDTVSEPIDGQPNQIPWQLLAAIAYREMFFAPKQGVLGFNWQKHDRTTEILEYRDHLNGSESAWHNVEGGSLGVCQMQPQTLATVLTNPGSPIQATYTSFLEEDKLLADGTLRGEQRLQAYLALSPENRIDLFNLLRFPKSAIRMCNIALQKLKNRSHRVPQLDYAGLLADQKALMVIATEYNQGPTTTPWATAGENAYGREVYTIVTSPMMQNLPTLSNLVMELWGVVLGDNLAPIADVRVDLYETWVIPHSDLKYWQYKEDFRNSSAPFGRLVDGEEYRVLEVIRNFMHNNQPLALVKVRVETSLWQKHEGWIVARDGDSYYANLISRSSFDVARTNNLGQFKVTYNDAAPVKLRFVKEADASGRGYFDGESSWGQAPSYYKVTMQAADYMIKESEILVLLPDWEGYVYSAAWAANYPNEYYLGSDHDDLRGYDLDEPTGQEIACNSFTQALITEAWFRRYPQLRWSFDNWRGHIIVNVWDSTANTVGFDPYGPMAETLQGDGTVTMSVPVDINDGRLPPRWSLVQGWSTWAPTSANGQSADAGTIAGHSFIVVDCQPDTGKLLTLEANSGYDLNGVGFRRIGNISNEKVSEIITPNRDRLWIEKEVVTWDETLTTYGRSAEAFTAPTCNPIVTVNPIGIVRLKVYDLKWSGAEVL